MKNLVGLAAFAGSVLLGFVAPAFGQTTVHFTGINNPDVFAGGYVDPYDGTVTQGSSPTVLNNGGLIVCDDFNDEIYIPETWNVTTIEASDLNASDIGDTKFGSTIGLQGYAAVANLVSTLLSQPATPTGQQNENDLSEAIWWITSVGQSPAGSTGTISTGPLYLGSNVLDAAALSDVQSVASLLTGSTSNALGALSNDSGLWILTPISGSQSTGGYPQEMWITAQSDTTLVSPVPEGGAGLLYLLLGGASCFGAMFLASRGRVGRTVTA